MALGFAAEFADGGIAANTRRYRDPDYGASEAEHFAPRESVA
jgi:hypothetical protein